MPIWRQEDKRLQINNQVSIPLDELSFRFSRSGGPGGQNVNRTETQVELLYDVGQSPSLTEAQRARVLHRLRSYIDKNGILHLVSQGTSSQRRNREDVIERFRSLLDQGLHIRRRRIATRPSIGAKETRLRRKRRQSLTKRQRGRVVSED